MLNQQSLSTPPTQHDEKVSLLDPYQGSSLMHVNHLSPLPYIQLLTQFTQTGFILLLGLCASQYRHPWILARQVPAGCSVRICIRHPKYLPGENIHGCKYLCTGTCQIWQVLVGFPYKLCIFYTKYMNFELKNM